MSRKFVRTQGYVCLSVRLLLSFSDEDAHQARMRAREKMSQKHESHLEEYAARRQVEEQLAAQKKLKAMEDLEKKKRNEDVDDAPPAPMGERKDNPRRPLYSLGSSSPPGRTLGRRGGGGGGGG